MRNTQVNTFSKLAASGSLDEKSLIIVMEAPHLSIDLPQSLFVIIDGSMKEEWYTLIWRLLTNKRATSRQAQS
jgi:hypothetical protein